MILTAKKFEVLWDATPCRLVNIHQIRGRHVQELQNEDDDDNDVNLCHEPLFLYHS